MKITRRGKEFFVVDGREEIATFDNFSVARQFLADNGNKDATGNMSGFNNRTIKAEATEVFTLNMGISNAKR